MKIATLFMCLIFSTCSTAQADSLRGTWRSSDPKFVAHIYKHSIRIDYDLDDGDSALYWKGTMPSRAFNGSSFVSKGNIEAMKYALLASSARTKRFRYNNGKLTFMYSIVGITRRVTLRR